MSAMMVYCTCPNQEEADRIASKLVESRLAACANIMSPHQSVYRWEGKIEREQEVVVILKTTEDHYSELEQTILSEHSYDCPCIVAWPIERGVDGFLDWIYQETGA